MDSSIHIFVCVGVRRKYIEWFRIVDPSILQSLFYLNNINSQVVADVQSLFLQKMDNYSEKLTYSTRPIELSCRNSPSDYRNDKGSKRAMSNLIR